MAELSIPITGAQHEISAGDYVATITELGANLRSLRHRDVPLITEYNANQLPPAASGELLLPWPNRIDGGRYAFDGETYQLDLSEPARGNAIHGLTRWASWQLVAVSEDRVELGLRLLGRTGYPFCLELRAEYRLGSAAGLEVTITADNAGARPAPFGTGSHPYLHAGNGSADDWTLDLPAAQWLPADDRGIPSGPPQDVTGTEFDFRGGRHIGATVLDHAFTGLSRDSGGRVWARLAGADGTVALWAGPGYTWLQAFTGDTLGPDTRRRAVAIEPMTCPPNAFVTGTDLETIAPGTRVRHQWGILAG
jgi:aldose 1-epimerase